MYKGDSELERGEKNGGGGVVLTYMHTLAPLVRISL